MSNFTHKHLKSLKKEKLIHLLLEQQRTGSKSQADADGYSALNSSDRPAHSLSPSGSSDDLSTVIRTAVVDAVRELKTELRVEYKALLSDLDSKFTQKLDSLRSEVDRLKSELDDRFVTFEKEVLQDIQEVEKRKNNVIIFGLNESRADSSAASKEDDLRSVASLSASLGVRDLKIQDCFRLGKRGLHQRPRPVKVICRDSQQRHSLISSAFRIPQLDQDLGFRRVFIKPDLSPKEQEADRLLRQELKSRRAAGERVFLRGGRFVTDTNLASLDRE